jgi:cysteine desulfurase
MAHDTVSFARPTEKPSPPAQPTYTVPRFGGVTLPAGLIYLDNAAATPVCLPAFEAMTPWLVGVCGNPSNRLHPMGELSEHALAEARATLARACAATPEEIVFVASATEANNLVLRGLACASGRKRHRIVVGATEHSSVLATALRLAELDTTLEVITLPVDSQGQVNINTARALLDTNTLCLSLMDVNNETGIVQEALPAVATLARSLGVHVHVDAVQGFARGAFGKRNDAGGQDAFPYDTAVVSGAKMNGPKGAAALVLRKKRPRIRLESQLTGGGQEGHLRSGTPNVPAIVGFAHAVEWYQARRGPELERLARLEALFLSTLRKKLLGSVNVSVHGEGATRVPGIASIHLEGVNAMKLIEEAKLVAVSVGSACRTLQATASHVLLAMGASDEVALASFRVSFGLCNEDADALMAASLLAEAALKVRSYSAVFPS